MAGEQERIQKYEQELARLDQLYLHLEGLWRYVPRYGLLALLALPVWYFASFGWAVVELLVTASLVATQAYLIGVRKNENRWNRALIERDLARLREEIAQGRHAV
jgi:hypothetical protein